MKIAVIVLPAAARATPKPAKQPEAISEETWNVLLDLWRISEWTTHDASVLPTLRRP